MASARLSFSFPEDMKTELVTLAKRERRSLSSYIQNVLEDHVKEIVKVTSRKSKRRKQNVNHS